MKILILEDNATDAELLQRELNKSGMIYTSERVQTREAFERALENFNPDIILSDFSLPAFDGVSAFHIKQRKSPDIPFIIVSGTIGEENAVELIKSGITDYAMKDKLFTLVPKIIRAMNDAATQKQKKTSDEALRMQHDALFEIAILQSHQVRAPVANILGLFHLFQFDNPGDPINAEILGKLNEVAKSLDKTIQQIVQKTSMIKRTI